MKTKKTIIDYVKKFDEYRIYELDGNTTISNDEDEAIAIAKKLYGDDVEVKINEVN